MTTAGPPYHKSTPVRPALDEDALRDAAAIIAAGGIVAVPTETVYGLAADATSNIGVARIYAAKGRPDFNPLICHVAGLDMAEGLAVFSSAARALAEAFWPGPLTLVLPLRHDAGISKLVTAGLSTIALRCPAHPAMHQLIALTNRALAAPSANASGRISPTQAPHILCSLNGRIDMILDGGATTRGIESTIVRVDAGALTLLRPGPVTAEDMTAATGLPVSTVSDGKIQAPGQLASHYAPSKPLRLNAVSVRDGEYLIGFGAVRGDATLSASGDLVEACARLFAMLHAADNSVAQSIAIAPVPEIGLGVAINDRLKRAAV